MNALPSNECPQVTILGSGVALGVYIPALLVERQLALRGVASETAVVETLYQDASRARLWEHKRAYHRDFSMALLAQRMTRSVGSSLDDGRVEALLARWQEEERRNFIVWSGFWMPILESYRRRIAPSKPEIDICRIDAVISASFRGHRRRSEGEREVWFWSFEERRIVHEIPVDAPTAPPYEARNDRLVVHGGGWGMGTYQSKIPELEDRGFQLDVVGYEPADVAGAQEGRRYFMVDPDYAAWDPAPGERSVFPPFGEVTVEAAPTFACRDARHELYDVIAASKAIVSKPGGGTLIDSLASATPVVLLEPFGPAEEKNGELWRHLGYGVAYEDWAARDFDPEILAALHHNLVVRRKAPSYPELYAERLCSAGGAGD